MSWQFNPFTGSFDIKSDFALGDVDRLTSQVGAGSTLILTDNSTNQTLAGSLGTLIINPTGECTINAQLTAEKFITNYTTDASFDTAKLQTNITSTAVFDNPTLRGCHVDMDYVISGSGHNAIPTIYANYANINVSAVSSGALLLNTYGLFVGEILANGAASPGLQGGAVGVNVAVGANDSSAATFGAFTKSTNAGTAIAYGYEGYGNNTSSGTGLNAIGVWGFAASSSGLMVGIQGQPFTASTKGFSFYAPSGHVHINSGNIYIYKATTLAAVAAKTHLTNATGQGALWTEGPIECDGILWGDGGANVGADAGGTAGFLGLTNVFPALGGGAAPTLGTIGGTGPAAAAQAGWIKMYNGAAAIYVPYWQ